MEGDALEVVIGLLSLDEYNDDNLWSWPKGWSPADRREFRKKVCQYYDWEPDDFSISHEESSFYVRNITEYLVLALEPELYKWDEVLTQEQSDKVRDLARVQAKREHDEAIERGGILNPHSGFFDECDHEDCRLIRSLEEDEIVPLGEYKE